MHRLSAIRQRLEEGRVGVRSSGLPRLAPRLVGQPLRVGRLRRAGVRLAGVRLAGVHLAGVRRVGARLRVGPPLLVRLHRLGMGLLVSLLLGVQLLVGCAQAPHVVRDPAAVEEYRLRISKVRNAIEETRATLAASRDAPYQAELLMRLAELLSEEARYHYMLAYEREQRKTQSLHVPQVRFLKAQAVGTYQFILERHPSTPLADRILFNISHEQRELGQFEAMKQTLERLIQGYPDSPYRSEALLVLGDHYFDASALDKAQTYYQQIVDDPVGPLTALAHYKLAWIHINLTDCKQALSSFEQALEASREMDGAVRGGLAASPPAGSGGGDQVGGHPPSAGLAAASPPAGSGGASVPPLARPPFEVPRRKDVGLEFAGHQTLNVRREALVDLTYCYAQERKPEDAVAYLKARAANREVYVAALARMARRYAFIEQPRGAAEVSRALLRLAPDDVERLDDARMLHNVVVRLGDYTTVGEDVALILRASRRQVLRPDMSEEVALSTREEAETLARDLATRAHALLMKKGKTLEAGDWTPKPPHPHALARAYEAYLEAVPDSPFRFEMVQNLADVLMEDKRFVAAGHRYTEAAQLAARHLELGVEASAGAGSGAGRQGEGPEGAAGEGVASAGTSGATAQVDWGQERRALIYSAGVAYQKALEAGAAQGHYARAVARAGLRRAGAAYLEAGGVEEAKGRILKFAIGKSYYDEGRYLEAIDLLTAVVYEYPGTTQGEAAVHIVLDSYRTINDIDGLIFVGRRFLAPDSPLGSGLKGQIRPVVASAEQRRLDELSLAAAGEQPGGMDALLAFVDRYKGTELGERALLNTFLAARAEGDAEQLYSIGERILKEFPGSEQAAGLLATMGRFAATRFELERAIAYLERAAARSEDQEAALLLAAGELREQLSDRAGALRDYQASVAAGAAGPTRSQAIIRLVELVERGGSPAEMAATLAPFAKDGDPEVASRLGMALLRMGKVDEAEEQLRGVVEGAVGGSPESQARAHYGMAEILLSILEDFELEPDLGLMEEIIGLVDVTIQSYLSAARAPSPAFSQAALARLARAAALGASLLEAFQIPAEVTGEDRVLLAEALRTRAMQLRSGRDEALGECAQRARTLYRFDATGRACLGGHPPAQDPLGSKPPLRARKKGPAPAGLAEVRVLLSRNPNDIEALRTVGRLYMEAGDYHVARLAFTQAVEAGGTGEDINRLAICTHQVGDRVGAMETFGRARNAGSRAASYNLAALLEEVGLHGVAEELLEALPGPGDGMLLDKAKARAGGGQG